MHRCFLDESYFTKNYQIGDKLEISGDEAAHISKVLRLKKDDIFEMCNNTSTTYVCRIDEVSKKSLQCEVVNSYVENSSADTKVFVFQALSKGTKMDLVIQKSVELGAYMLIPVATEFSVVKINDESSKINRWKKISLEAAKQCKRNIIMNVHEPVSYKEAIKMLSELDLGIVAYECEKDTSLRSVLKTIKEKGSIGMFVGPEGGFSKSEIEYAKEKSINTVTLGKRILRTETAAIALLSAIMYEANELG